ncbi:hypothetical protein BK671_17630 [Pseudomonas fluorescens]|uniref:Uncharacterized protein n=2 Tax=Pseudomonas fluorescens TaxID=294 RepID=A0A423LBY9_PSEFL|nr:hypothetical protein BK671_17630 [Pseudomonas fluorescens]
MVRPSGCKARHVTCIWQGVGGMHGFDMQSSGGFSGVIYIGAINGFLMSFLVALRSLTEQVASGVRLMIESVSTPLMSGRVCDEA